MAARKGPGLLARARRSLGRWIAPAGAQASVYAGGAMSRLVKWITGPLSADQTIRDDLRGLRDAARTLERDNPWAARYIALCSENIVGPDGYQLQAQVARGEELDEDVNAAIEAAWLEFCRPEHCTVDGRQGMTDVETQAIERWQGADGEYLVQIVEGGTFGIQLQPLDADLLDEQYCRDREIVHGGTRNEIRHGVEVDERGRPVAYHLWTSYPGEARFRNRERRRVPAEDVLHLYTPKRPGQTRGVTRFAPVLNDLSMLGGMQEAVLVLQRTVAAKMGWLKPNDRYNGPLTPPAGEERIRMEVEPGLIDQLPDGFDFENWDPGQPGPEYDPFTKNVLRAIAAGLGVSYMSLTGDLTGASYSSARVGLLDERRRWRRDQEAFREQFHERLYARWLRAALLSGALRLRSFNPEQFRAVVWLMPGWAWVDPTKDVDTALAEVDAGLNSLTSVAAQNGRNFEVILRQRRREIQLAKRLGVPINLARGATPVPQPGTPGQPAADDETGASAPSLPSDTAPAAVRLLRG